MKSKLFLSLSLLTAIIKGSAYQALGSINSNKIAVEACRQMSMFRVMRNAFGQIQLQMLNKPEDSRYVTIDRNIAKKYLPEDWISLLFRELEDDVSRKEFTGVEFFDKYNRYPNDASAISLFISKTTGQLQWAKIKVYKIQGQNENIHIPLSEDEVSNLLSADQIKKYVDTINKNNLSYLCSGMLKKYDLAHDLKNVHAVGVSVDNLIDTSSRSVMADVSIQQILDATANIQKLDDVECAPKPLLSEGPAPLATRSIDPAELSLDTNTNDHEFVTSQPIPRDQTSVVPVVGADVSLAIEAAKEKAMHRQNNQRLLGSGTTQSEMNTASSSQEAKSGSYYDRFKAACEAGVGTVCFALIGSPKSEETSDLQTVPAVELPENLSSRHDAGIDFMVDKNASSWFDRAQAFGSKHQLSVGTGVAVATVGICYLAYVNRAAMCAKLKSARDSAINLFGRK